MGCGGLISSAAPRGPYAAALVACVWQAPHVCLPQHAADALACSPVLSLAA